LHLCHSSVAHLAGALGVPVFLILAFPYDPRWGYGSERTVWYPHHRLRRSMVMCYQEDDWAEVIEDLRDELAWAMDHGELKRPERCR
jgi:hypothetical protein